MNIQMEELEKDMTPILLEDLGMRYPTEKSKRKFRYGLYKCQYCEKKFEARLNSITSGNTNSCGCMSRNTIHNLAHHRLYSIWKTLKSRCTNPNNKRYKYYGGRGIKVCDRWLDVRNFVADMYPSYQEGLTLDRIDVNGNYEPDNCRWTTQSIQMCNTRDIQLRNTSGYRGVCWDKISNKWAVYISINYKRIFLGYYQTALAAAKAYERYVRINNLEHNFTPVLTEEEIEMIIKEDK